MMKQITLRVDPENGSDLLYIKDMASKALKVSLESIDAVQVLRRSLDARSRKPVFQIQVAVYCGEPLQEIMQPVSYRPVKEGKTAIVVGTGPAGLFAALRLIEHGIRPILLERGKNVRERRFDLKTINTDGTIHPDSNYCFGEGGAGTYSDGKLFTRSTKRGDVKKMLSILVHHGAVRDILINAHPHVGSNRLPKIIESMRNTILECNGEIHFNARVMDLIIKEGAIKGVTTRDGEYPADAVVLATGHSARDIYDLLDQKGILLEAKSYAMGVRVEHPQALIDSIQYRTPERAPFLPVASYSLACQVGKTGVYSFCMCPGGMLVPAATAPGELVLNGMSNSLRNMPLANAGMVVTVGPELYQKYSKFNHFAGLELQKEMERKAYEAGGKTLAAPAQRLTDFLEDRVSSTLPKTSYIPGMASFPLADVLGPFISDALKQGFSIFDKKMKGYVSQEATLLGVESRTSSPVRIPRRPDTRMHPQVSGLFPAGEGSGYAGGIISSAIDGDASADGVFAYLAQ
ncbi:MAG: FAD-dependent oxidoreductase [Desulfobacterium sp.]|nr:FAD-dependent oxidoreductase [Desulfobacterium sp.]